MREDIETPENLVIDDYVRRKGIPLYGKALAKANQREGKKGKKQKPLSPYQIKYIENELLKVCSNHFIRLNRKFLNYVEEDQDLGQEGAQAFLYSLYSIDRYRLPDFSFRKDTRSSKRISLNKPAFKTAKFKKFVHQFIKTQKNQESLRKIYGKDFELFREGALEWLSRQVYARFLRYVRGCIVKENQRHKNKARNTRNLTSSKKHIEPEAVVHIVADVAEEASDEQTLLKKFLYPEDKKLVLFRDFLSDIAENWNNDLDKRKITILKNKYKGNYEHLKNHLIDLYCALGQEVPDFYPEANVEKSQEDLLSKDFPK